MDMTECENRTPGPLYDVFTVPTKNITLSTVLPIHYWMVALQIPTDDEPHTENTELPPV
jgi:hypothetical protein